MSYLPERIDETESLVRTSCEVDLGHLLLASVSDPSKRALLEEAIVSFGDDMRMVGHTLGREEITDEVLVAHFHGMAVAMDIIAKVRGDQ